MPPDRESEIERICQAALEREGSARAAFLAEACAGDAALQREVESLLAQESAGRGLPEHAGGGARERNDRLTAHPSSAGNWGRTSSRRDLAPAAWARCIARTTPSSVATSPSRSCRAIFTSDPERLARFEREARLLASLNHPNIGAIYGLEDVGRRARAGPRARRGRDAGRAHLAPAGRLPARLSALTDRRARSPTRSKRRTNAASSIAISSRPTSDRPRIWPSRCSTSVWRRPSDGDASSPDLSQSPTITIDGTKEGVILGTAAYMSPEQARGKPVDKRADIWAFGCVLYEMLTGRLAFPGDTLSDTIASILQGEPDWRALPETTPAGIRRLLRRCLEKDPTRRLRDIGDARLDIEEALTTPAPSQTLQAPSWSAGGRRVWPGRSRRLVSRQRSAWRSHIFGAHARAMRTPSDLRWPRRLMPCSKASHSPRMADDWRSSRCVPVQSCCGSVHSMRLRRNRSPALKGRTAHSGHPTVGRWRLSSTAS